MQKRENYIENQVEENNPKNSSGKKSKTSVLESEVERELEHMRMIKDIAMMKQALEGENYRHKIDESGLIDTDVLNLIRKQRKAPKMIELSPSPMKLTRKTPRKSLTPRRR